MQTVCASPSQSMATRKHTKRGIGRFCEITTFLCVICIHGTSYFRKNDQTFFSSSFSSYTFLGNFAKFLRKKNWFSAFVGFFLTCEGDFSQLYLWFMHQKTIHLQNTRQPRQSQSISWNHSKIFPILFEAREILFPDPTCDSSKPEKLQDIQQKFRVKRFELATPSV